MQAKVLNQILSRGARCASTRSSLPILAYVKLQVEPGSVEISSTSLEKEITCTGAAEVAEMWAVCVPAKTLSDLVAVIAGEVTLEHDPRTNSLTVKTATGKTKINGMSADEFPAVHAKDLGAITFDMPFDVLAGIAQRVSICVSVDEARPVLQGVLITSKNNYLAAVATDGFRVTAWSTEMDSPEFSVVVPGTAIVEAAKLMVGDMQVTVSAGAVTFSDKNTTFTTRLIEGNFPDHNAIMPKSFKYTAEVHKSEFVAALRQASVMAGENKVCYFDFAAESTMTVRTVSDEMGECNINVETVMPFGALPPFAANLKFLREILEATDGPRITISVNQPNMPIGVQGLMVTHKTVIMPMKR